MSSKRKHVRWRLFADARVQGQLCFRVVIYWLVCQFTMVGAMIAFASLGGTEQVSPDVIWSFVGPAFFASLMILPFALLDAVGFSNRFSGPIHNFRQRFADLVSGKPSRELNFRPGDYYEDLAENFNLLRKQQPFSDNIVEEPVNESVNESESVNV